MPVTGKTPALVVGAVALVTGVPLVAGGAWLIQLGGSWYYALAGLGLLVTAILLFRGAREAVWVYGLTWVATLAWAIWESGTDGWALMPRLLAPTLLLLAVLAVAPSLRPRGWPRPVVAMLAGALVGTAGWALAAATSSISVLAQEQSADPGDGPPFTAAPEAAASAAASSAPAGADWPAYGGTHHGTRYSMLDEITPENVAGLEVAWTYHTGDMPSEAADGKYSPENTPLKVGDDLFLCSAKGIAIAVDAATGGEEWRHDPEVSDDAIPYGATCRGVAFYAVPDAAPDEACATRILWGTLDARLIAVDARTGQPCADFGNAGEVRLEEGIGETAPGWYSLTSPPTIVRGIAVVGAQVLDGQAEDSPSGVVRGYDAVTGELAWAWDIGNPGNRGAPAEGEVYTRGTPNMWSVAAADEALGLVYLPLGNSAVDYFGSNRSAAENEYATSVVAVDVTTGEDVWHFRTVHNDVWDYDLGSQPALVDVAGAEGTIPALVLATKQGDMYVLDRRTGAPLHEVEERPVPQGGVEPDYLSPTQPFSGFATVARPPLREADMWGATPLDQLWCRIQFRRAAYEGMYTPPTSDRHWIQYPGYNGGSDWGGVAVDTASGVIVTNYNDTPNYNRLVPREEAEAAGLRPITEPGGREETSLGEAGAQAGAPYAIQVNAGWRVPLTGLLCKQPPYGGIRAIDLATGETLWDRSFGTARRNGPFGIPSMLPIDIGTPNNGGPVITAGGLIFVAATTDNLIHAIDLATGETLWTDVLPGGGQATPMVYEADGRQFVVIAPGGHHFMETPISDAVVAYALPAD